MSKLFFICFSAFVISGCAKVGFEQLSEQAQPSTETEKLIKSIRPSLVGQRMSCTMCHASVRSSVIYAPKSDEMAWMDSSINGALTVSKNTKNSGFLDGFNWRQAPTAIRTVEEVAITPPTENLIRVRSGLSEVNNIKVMPGSSVSGFAWSGTLQAFTNTGDMTCEGDIVTTGAVLLRTLNIRSVNGCRIYSTRSIFVEGAINWRNSDGNRNLQLISSRIVSFGSSMSMLQNRFQRMSSGIDLTAIQSDGANLNLVDADNSGQAGLGFNRILVAAPAISSRYQGNFLGVLIGETILMRVGQMIFEFDPVFSSVGLANLIGIDSLVQIKE